MITRNRSCSIASGLLAAAAVVGVGLSAPAFAQLPATPKVFAGGFDAPRGLKFGPDGYLYVAEAGTGGTISTGKTCEQVPGPVGPYTGGNTARVSKVSPKGVRTTVAGNFPSTVDAQGDLIGVADVAFLNGQLYALVAGGGCSHGHTGEYSGIAKVELSGGHYTMIANVGAWLKTHPAKYEAAGDFEPDGTLYNFIPYQGKFYAVEPNHGQVLTITTSGQISEFIDISASEGHIVPTSIAAWNGLFFVGNLNLFPINPQWARILTITPDGNNGIMAPGFETQGPHIVNSKAGFTTVLAVAFGPDGLLYALELSDAAGYPTPGDGKVVRVGKTGDIEDVVTGLAVPGGMTFGPDGALYISNLSAVPLGAAPAGSGQILKVTVAP